MVKYYISIVLIYFVAISSPSYGKQDIIYDPDWPSIDSRPLPPWYDEGKVGIFIHWAIFSVPATVHEWFWIAWKEGWCDECSEYMTKNFKPGFTYQEFAPLLTAEFFDPNQWADLFEKAGAKYVVLTSKHHDGYTLWPSKYSYSWNSVDIGPHRDIVGDLSTAIRNRTSLRFGLYHSLYEWFNPMWMSDKANEFETDEFVRFKVTPSLHEVVNAYRPDILWSDGEWEAHESYWKSREFLAWLYNDSPVKDSVVVNDRWGAETRGEHGGYWTLDDRTNPGYLLPHKWENCMTIEKRSWAHRKEAGIEDYLTPEELITTLVETVSCGGNILINVGPTKEGTILPVLQERLLQMGEWLEVNGEAIYKSVPWTVQNDTVTSGVWYTTNQEGTRVFAMVTKWPDPGESVHLASVEYEAALNVTMLGYNDQLLYAPASPGIRVSFPPPNLVNSSWVWTVVIST